MTPAERPVWITKAATEIVCNPDADSVEAVARIIEEEMGGEMDGDGPLLILLAEVVRFADTIKPILEARTEEAKAHD